MVIIDRGRATAFLTREARMSMVRSLGILDVSTPNQALKEIQPEEV
ncbi:hypothetical protein IQE94_03065 [Synechocystis sp. PCC 7339]|nr:MULTISPECIES: hypothetical protein [unclassified Synechocystis]QUS59228.1 hypothetical protein HTZ78_11000 [Synechocystis sp. PCC 7338]UAJ74549.1 hypothetical protein IQE94_03065 [Synechocystis sp. PCC 7339]